MIRRLSNLCWPIGFFYREPASPFQHGSGRRSGIKLLYLGATRFSAGSRTDVGGYTMPFDSSTPQFEISDNREVEEIINVIRENGMQPVFKDWELI